MKTIITRLNAEQIAALMRPNNYSEITLDKKTEPFVSAILEQTKRLAPMAEDDVRAFWVNVVGEDGNPRWFKLRTWVYGKNYGLDIMDERNMSITCLTNKESYGYEFQDYGYLKAILSKLLADLKDLIDSICRDARSYNEYVENNLPKQLRHGRISREKLVELVPEYKLSVAEPSVARQALIALIGNRTPTLKKMTIREYCKWYRIAFNAFHHHEETEDERRKYSDTEFYDRHSTCCRDAINSGGYNIDSEKDFVEFAKGHYGEIGLTRCDLFGKEYGAKQWKIVISASYTVTTENVLNMLAALYKAGAPLYLHNPADYLAALDGTDFFAVKPNVYHDYRSSNDDDCGGSLAIPFPDEVFDDLPPEETTWTTERLNAVIATTEWEPLPKVKKNSPA